MIWPCRIVSGAFASMQPRRTEIFPRRAGDVLAAGLSLALLAGCATYEPNPLVPTETAAAFEKRSLESPELRKFIEEQLGRELNAWPPDAQAPGWTLNLLTLAAYYYQPSLDVARANWAETRAALITAGGRPNPIVGIQPGYNFNPAAGALSPWIPGATIDLPIETAGKRGYRVTHARQLAAAARWQLAGVAWQVRAGVRDALLNFSDAMRREELLGEQFRLQEQWVARLQQRVEAGAIPRADVTPAKITLEKLRLEVAGLRQLKGESTVRLAEAVGISVAALNQAKGIALAWNFPVATKLTSEAARQRALTHRTDVAATLAEYEAAQTALQLEIAKQYPDVHLGTGYQWDQGESKWSFPNLSAELPLLNRNQGPIAEAQARRATAAVRVEAAQAKAITEIDAALAAHQAARGRLGTMELLAAEQEKQAAAIEAQARAGALDGLDLISAKIELAQLHLAQWDAGVKALQAAGRLEDALQTPLESESTAAAPGNFIETNPRTQKQQP